MSSLRSKPEQKDYWRSVERLLDSPAVRDAQQSAGNVPPRNVRPAGGKRNVPPAGGKRNEVADGASDTLGGVDRRTMLGLMGASFALAGLEGCRRPVETIVPYVSAPEYVVPGIPKRYATTLPFGAGAHGVVVESHEGRPTKIEGNELHPSSLGAANTWTQAEVLNLFDPDRSTGVKRKALGEDAHRPSSWAFFDAFLAERRAELEADGGASLAVLSGAYSSPTVARQANRLKGRFPQARWVVHEALGDDNVFAGCEMATGTACRPVYHLEKARKILALDADLLHTESESLAAARGFATGRKVSGAEGDMNRLYVVESALSLTGSSADHRLSLKSREIGAFAVALARELGVETGFAAGDAGVVWPEAVGERLKVLAADLQASPGEALVIAGRRQPAAVHALALAINQALGSLGQTLTLHPLEDVGRGAAQAVADLVAGMREGTVKTLLILGGNPAYTMPADLDFAGALASVEHTIHLSSTLNETSQNANWHLPEAHALEAWGDARAADGSLSVVQPLIAPLHEGRSGVEFLEGLLVEATADATAPAAARSGYDVVRETWLDILGTDGFDRKWRRVLHDGIATEAVLGESTGRAGGAQETANAEAITVGVARVLPAEQDAGVEGDAAAGSADTLELTFQPSLATWDGRYANNAWLQELPDALTKITWDNAALISPATAEQFDLGSGDLVTLGYRDRTLDVPVFVLPGQADGSVALALGYGRTAAGRVGDGVGVNAYLLRHSTAPDFDSGLSLTKIKGSHLLAQTQEHWDMEGRDLIREATLADYREEHGGEEHGSAASSQLFPSFDYSEGSQWGLAIDLGSCIGCNACVVACQSENNIPVVGKDQVSRGREMHWLRIDRYFSGTPDDPEVAFQPVPCMHCENAPCEQVCPVAATVHGREGLNAMVYNRCIGTRYCSNNCPYKVRRFNFFNYTKDTPELMKMAMNPDVTVRSRGVMEKCSYCLQRINEAKIAAKHQERPVADGEIKTACQQTCPTSAIVFGNIRDPESAVSKQKHSDLDYVLLGELNNRPRTSYQTRLRNPNPEWA